MRRLLIALDSVGIDPLGTDRPESVYADSRLLFPRGAGLPPRRMQFQDWSGVLVETDVTDGQTSGAIECALTYTSMFSGQSAVRRHGLMSGLGLNERLLEQMIQEFYKYQMADLVSHTGRVGDARAVFEQIERLVEAVLTALDPADSLVIISSDHGHLEQLTASRGHPKSHVPTWCFSQRPIPDPQRLARPEGIYAVLGNS